VGWEKNAQIRPSTGTADMKESYQLQFGMYFRAIFGNEWMMIIMDCVGENMKDSWISEDELPSFKDTALNFMQRTQAVSERLMLCFARVSDSQTIISSKPTMFLSLIPKQRCVCFITSPSTRVSESRRLLPRRCSRGLGFPDSAVSASWSEWA